jgi:ABC-type sugar transport system permease subunit
MISKRRKRILRNFWLFIIPALVIYTVFWVIPILFNFGTSLTNWRGVSLFQSDFIGLKNYINVFKNRVFYSAISNNLFFMVMNIIFIPTLSFIVAILLEKFIKRKDFFRTSLFIPAFLPMLLVAILFRWVYSVEGMVNSLLSVIGLESLQRDFLGDSDTAIYALFVMGLWKAMPFYMIILLSGLQGIPHDIEEASIIDGANFPQQVMHVIIPLLKPILVVVYGLVLIDAFRIFELVFVTTRGGPGYYTTEVMTTFIYRSAFNDFRMGFATSLSTINILIVVAFSLIYFRFSLKSNIE